MANKNVTEARVKNVMKQIPKNAGRNGGKMRNTMKATFKGMKTLVGQLSKHRKEYKTSYEKKKKHKETMRLLWMAAGAGAVIFLLIIYLIYRFKI
jgi:hypothetical protein